MNMKPLWTIALVAGLAACASAPPASKPAPATASAQPAAPAAEIPVPGVANGVHFAGGDGSSQEKAVIVLGANEMTGVESEYLWLAAHFPGYKRGQQGLVQGQGGKSYDVLDFTTADGEKRTVYFDITDFFGKF